MNNLQCVNYPAEKQEPGKEVTEYDFSVIPRKTHGFLFQGARGHL